MHTKRRPSAVEWGGWRRTEGVARGERPVERVAAINIKQNVGKANIVIKNNNNRRASEGSRGKTGGTEGERPTPGDEAVRWILRLRRFLPFPRLTLFLNPLPEPFLSFSLSIVRSRINTSIRSEFSPGIYETHSPRTNSNNR